MKLHQPEVDVKVTVESIRGRSVETRVSSRLRQTCDISRSFFFSYFGCTALLRDLRSLTRD